MNAMSEPVAPDIGRVLKHNARKLGRHVAGRVAIGIPLFSVPFVSRALGGPESFFLMLFMVAGLYVLLFLVIRLANGLRLRVCKKVLRTYPLEYRTRVDLKSDGDWLLLGTVHIVKVCRRGQHGAPRMRAVNASAVRRWPKGAENGGAWFAGDPLFGGVMIVPDSLDMLFMQPAQWKQQEQERAQADPARIAKAQQAGIAKLIEREPRMS